MRRSSENQAIVDAACRPFPRTFTVRGAEGTFRVSNERSRVVDGEVLLALERLDELTGVWEPVTHRPPAAILRVVERAGGGKHRY